MQAGNDSTSSRQHQMSDTLILLRCCRYPSMQRFDCTCESGYGLTAPSPTASPSPFPANQTPGSPSAAQSESPPPSRRTPCRCTAHCDSERCTSQPALAAGGTKHQFSGDQRTPGKRPADFQPGEDRRQCGRNQDEQHEAHALEAIVAPGHAQGFRHTEKPGVGFQRQGPEHRMHQIRRVDPPC